MMKLTRSFVVRLLILAAAASFVLGLAGPTPTDHAAAEASRLDVVTTTSMIGDAARAIAGDRAEVTHLMGEGIDPHTYRQTRSDVVRLGEADLVLWNGLFLEAQLEDLLLRLGERKPVVAVAETLPTEVLLKSEEFEGRYDPHVWMDAGLWAEVVHVIRDTLIEHDPDGEPDYLANAEGYLEEIAELDDYARSVLASVPESARALVTAHDAFQYFGRAYDFEVIGIQGISTDSEAGLREIEDIVSLIVEREIGAVFFENSVTDRNVRALVEGAQARGHELIVGGELFSDAMGSPGSYEGTYIGMIDHNVTTITRALDGDAPELGMNGRLEAAM
jgi:manganese/zinc/iron transport system substrate-binding protein